MTWSRPDTCRHRNSSGVKRQYTYMPEKEVAHVRVIKGEAFDGQHRRWRTRHLRPSRVTWTSRAMAALSKRY